MRDGESSKCKSDTIIYICYQFSVVSYHANSLNSDELTSGYPNPPPSIIMSFLELHTTIVELIPSTTVQIQNGGHYFTLTMAITRIYTAQ